MLLVSNASGALGCAKISHREGLSKFPALLTPNRQAVVWLEVVSKSEPRSDVGKLFIKDSVKKRSEVIFQANVSARGNIVLQDGTKTKDNYHVFCFVDWSPDSRYLLVRETIGAADGDTWSDRYWTFDRNTWKSQKLDLAPLRKSVAELLRKRQLLHRASHDVVALGWDEKMHRVVFQAYPYHTPEDFFIGIWSVSMSGKDPRLLTEKENGSIVKQFGVLQEQAP